MHRSRSTLSDGRELFYYDRTPTRRDASDLRGLPPAATAAQLRWNPLFGEYSVIAEHRQTRSYQPAEDECPLCPSRGGRHTEIPDGDYDVVVFENRFPSFALAASGSLPTVDEPLFQSVPAAGRCEVVCFASDHDLSFARFDQARARLIVDVWADRTRELSLLDGVAYVFCFENRGPEIGVTLSHPHGQIYAYPFVPPRAARAADAARAHRERGGCLQCDLLAAELAAGERIVVESAHWVAYVPFAARWPYELRLVPRAHVADLPSLDDAQRDDLAVTYLDVLRRMDALFDAPAPYIAGWQQAAVRRDRDVAHLAAEVFTVRRAPRKLKYLAGSESAAEVWINDVVPEAAAAQLRAAGTAARLRAAGTAAQG